MKDALTIMKDIVGTVGQHGRRHRRGSPDGDAGLSRQGIPRRPAGLDGRHRRLRAGRHRDDARAGDGLQRLPVPVDRGLGAVGGRRRRPLRQVRGHPAADAFLEFLTTTEAAEIWAGRGGFSSPHKDLSLEHLSRRDHAHDSRRARGGRDVPLRPLGPAAGGIRRDSGSGPVQGLLGLRGQPEQHRQDHAADGGRRKEGLPVGE